jgi:hypothetical protein
VVGTFGVKRPFDRPRSRYKVILWILAHVKINEELLERKVAAPV